MLSIALTNSFISNPWFLVYITTLSSCAHPHSEIRTIGKIADLLATSDHPSPTAHRRLFESLLSNLLYTLASNFSYTFDREYFEMSSQRMHHPFRPFRSSSFHISIYPPSMAIQKTIGLEISSQKGAFAWIHT